MSDHRWPSESIDENGEKYMTVWYNGEWHNSRNLAQNLSSTSQLPQYTRPLYSRDQPTVSSPSYSQGYSTSQSYSTGENQPTYLPPSSQGYSYTSQTYDTSHGYGTNQGYSGASQDYSTQSALQSQMSSMNVGTSYMQGRDPIPPDSGRRETSYAPSPTPIQYQTGYTSTLTGGSQMFEEPEEMDRSLSSVPSEAMFIDRRLGSGSGSGGSSRPFNFDYQSSMDNSARNSRGLEPKLKQMVRLPSGAFDNPRCGNPVITQQFYCLNCRPDLVQCSFQVANPNARLCDRVGQPELDPLNASIWPRVYQNFWNCPDHKTRINQGPYPPPARRFSSTSYGDPEPGLEIEEPALFKQLPKGQRSGVSRASYGGGMYMHKDSRSNSVEYTKEQWEAKLAEDKAERARVEREREHKKRDSGRHRKSSREQDGEASARKHRPRHSK
ncbi:uncharacterized protein EAF01_010472 [Botrytis porri]|uniref:uncharacterized protein n=1 Tax=Botrytis porri TaxID=87229 RepID=UPI001901FBDC|nr:uncharacterized protein EAF01_010472 [Botrytis porri]KAF7892392.1 hypothetical protein EAF01_010472 [Botrytis porri]